MAFLTGVKQLAHMDKYTNTFLENKPLPITGYVLHFKFHSLVKQVTKNVVNTFPNGPTDVKQLKMPQNTLAVTVHNI